MDNYLSNGARKSTNVFDEEIDDEEFLRHPRAGNAGYALPNQNNRPVSQHMTGQQRVRFGFGSRVSAPAEVAVSFRILHSLHMTSSYVDSVAKPRLYWSAPDLLFHSVPSLL